MVTKLTVVLHSRYIYIPETEEMGLLFRVCIPSENYLNNFLDILLSLRNVYY